MDRIKKIIYTKILNKDSSVEYDDVSTGINEYILINGLNTIANELNDDMLSKYMDAFLSPMDGFSGDMMVEYFKDFASLAKFKTISNQIFNCAKNKLLGKACDISKVNKFLEELTKLYAKLYNNVTMQGVLNNHLSESKLDVAFICDKSQNYSIRLYEVKKQLTV